MHFVEGFDAGEPVAYCLSAACSMQNAVFTIQKGQSQWIIREGADPVVTWHLDERQMTSEIVGAYADATQDAVWLAGLPWQLPSIGSLLFASAVDSDQAEQRVEDSRYFFESNPSAAGQHVRMGALTWNEDGVPALHGVEGIMAYDGGLWPPQSFQYRGLDQNGSQAWQTFYRSAGGPGSTFEPVPLNPARGMDGEIVSGPHPTTVGLAALEHPLERSVQHGKNQAQVSSFMTAHPDWVVAAATYETTQTSAKWTIRIQMDCDFLVFEALFPVRGVDVASVNMTESGSDCSSYPEVAVDSPVHIADVAEVYGLVATWGDPDAPISGAEWTWPRREAARAVDPMDGSEAVAFTSGGWHVSVLGPGYRDEDWDVESTARLPNPSHHVTYVRGYLQPRTMLA